MVLIIGLGIGCLVPAATLWWSTHHLGSSALNTLNPESIAAIDSDSESESYHFGLEQGVLSVIEGKPGESGNVIVTGLNVKAWPKEILDLAPTVEFYSLDEVQSFIDTAQEFPVLE